MVVAVCFGLVLEFCFGWWCLFDLGLDCLGFVVVMLSMWFLTRRAFCGWAVFEYFVGFCFVI